jgi:PAS domain S-box-containing protein
MVDKDKERLHKELEIARRQLAECKASEAKKRKQISALIENEERFNLFIENFPDPVISYTPDGSIQYVNKKIEEITGYSRKELIGKNIADPLLVSKESILTIEASLQKRKNADPTALHELEGTSKSGSRR